MTNIPPYFIYIFSAVFAGVCSAFSMPRIIIVAKRKKLFDLPDNHRKIHKEVIPNLGGIGIFFATMIGAGILVHPTTEHNWWHYMVSACLILFLIGIKDDIITLTPAKKFMAQIAASVIMVYFADIRLVSLHGIFGVHEMPYWISVCFSIIGCIFVTNAFNLIDGIDGLAGTIGVLCTFTLGTSLAFQGNFNAACFAFALMGALIGFLRYNIAPAKIFMGDSGSLFIGFSISVLCILFINSFTPHHFFAKFVHTPQSALIIALSILFIPVFDSFRVFLTRLAKGKHPFHADKIHLHHFLLDMGFSHTRTVTTLITANLLIISVSLLVQDYNPNIAIIAIFSLTFGLFAILYYMRRARLRKTEVLTKSFTQNDPPPPPYNGSEHKKANKRTEIEQPVVHTP